MCFFSAANSWFLRNYSNICIGSHVVQRNSHFQNFKTVPNNYFLVFTMKRLYRFTRNNNCDTVLTSKHTVKFLKTENENNRTRREIAGCRTIPQIY